MNNNLNYLTTKPNKIYYLTKNLKLIFSDAKVQLFSETTILLPLKNASN